MALDWHGAVVPAAEEGQLMVLLGTLAREQWTQRGPGRGSLLHYAAQGRNEDAARALLVHGLGVDEIDEAGWSPALHCMLFRQAGVLEVLCAAGATLRPLHGDKPLDMAIEGLTDSMEVARVLVANGVRLSTANAFLRHLIKPELEAFERGVLRCRAAVVAMLRVKQVGQLVRWDKYLLAELAVCIWSTRYDKGWQTSTQLQNE